MMLRMEWQSLLSLSSQALTLQNETPQVSNPLPVTAQGPLRNISYLN